MNVNGEILPYRLKLPAFFMILLLGAASCFAISFLIARFIGGSHSPMTAHALGAEGLVSLVLGLPYSIIGVVGGLSGKNWRVFASILIVHLIIVGFLVARAHAIGVKMGVASVVFVLVGLGMAQAFTAEYSFRWINRLWNNT